MPKATNGNQLVEITDCLIIAQCGQVTMQGLPEITDSKGATYSAENIIGRSTPLNTYSHSDARTINWEIPFYITEDADIDDNLNSIFCLESLVYPDSDNGAPPPTAQLQCGKLLERDGKPICAILRNYSIRYSSDVSWEKDVEGSLLPYKCVMSTTWEIVYPCKSLPNSSSILGATSDSSDPIFTFGG